MVECPIFGILSVSQISIKEVDNLSYKNVQYGRSRVRRNYARVQTNVDLPNSTNMILGTNTLLAFSVNVKAEKYVRYLSNSCL